MQKIIASFDCAHDILGECKKVFNLGVNLIEKEFDTKIECELRYSQIDKIIELRLIDATLQEWFRDIPTREIIIYKLSTHLKICVEQFLPKIMSSIK